MLLTSSNIYKYIYITLDKYLNTYLFTYIPSSNIANEFKCVLLHRKYVLLCSGYFVMM